LTQIKPTKTVATRQVSCVKNVPKMRLRRGNEGGVR